MAEKNNHSYISSSSAVWPFLRLVPFPRSWPPSPTLPTVAGGRAGWLGWQTGWPIKRPSQDQVPSGGTLLLHSLPRLTHTSFYHDSHTLPLPRLQDKAPASQPASVAPKKTKSSRRRKKKRTSVPPAIHPSIQPSRTPLLPSLTNQPSPSHPQQQHD